MAGYLHYCLLAGVGQTVAIPHCTEDSVEVDSEEVVLMPVTVAHWLELARTARSPFHVAPLCRHRRFSLRRLSPSRVDS